MKKGKEILDATERFLIRKALRATGGNKAQAARLLGCSDSKMKDARHTIEACITAVCGVHDKELVDLLESVVEFSRECEMRALDLVK